MASTTKPKPEILILGVSQDSPSSSFFDDQFADLLSKLQSRSSLKRAKSASVALQYLTTSNPDAIIIADGGLAEEAALKPVLDKVIEYVKNGGTAVATLHFPNFISGDGFDAFFAAFGLPWKRGDYHRTTFACNPESPLMQQGARGPSYSMKVLHVRNAKPQEKLYVPAEGAMTQSHVFPPGHVDRAQAAVTVAKVGLGVLVYIGDVNNEESSENLLLALLKI